MRRLSAVVFRECSRDKHVVDYDLPVEMWKNVNIGRASSAFVNMIIGAVLQLYRACAWLKSLYRDETVHGRLSKELWALKTKDRQTRR